MLGDIILMKKKTKNKKITTDQEVRELRREIRLLQNDIGYIKKHLDKLWQIGTESSQRLQDAEVQINLLSRLVVTLAIEKMNMRLSVLRRMIRRIEKDAITDSQIQQLESLYKLEKPAGGEEKKSKDSWPEEQ